MVQSLPGRYGLLFALIIFSIIVVSLVGIVYFNFQHDQLRSLAKNDLTAVADLKVGQIENWLKERRGNASLIYRNPAYFRPLLLWLGNRRDAGLKKEIRDWMASLCDSYGYSGIFLVDRKGDSLLSYLKKTEESLSHEKEKIAKALETGKIVFNDLHRDELGKIGLEFIVPILDNNSAAGVLVMRLDPEQFLYPLIQTWPFPSRSAETLLVRREGDEVVFINELRHQKDTLFKLRFPVSEKALPAAMAVRGISGVIEGKDYRGTDVLAAIRPVPGTDWFIVSKIDLAEVFQPTLWIGLRAFGTGILLIILAGSWFLYYEARRSQEALREGLTKLNKAEELAHLGTWELDLADNKLTWSDEVYRIFGLKPQEFKATYSAFLEAVHPDDRQIVDDAYLGSIREGKDCYEIEHRVVKKSSGKVLYVREKCEHLRDRQGKVTRSVGMVLDITDAKWAEQGLREIDRLKSDFIATASHELRTPLSIIKEGVGLVREGLDGRVTKDEQARFLDNALKNIDRLNGIVDSLLDISKIESGKVELNKTPLDLCVSVHKLVEDFSLKAKEKDLSLTFKCPENPLYINADKSKVDEILTNLISNSIKFTKPGGRISLTLKDRPGLAEVSVEDTGIGITAENLPKLFSKFEQFGRVAGPGPKGTGLGLAIVKGLVELHGGKIWAESDTQKGSTFTFTLPKGESRHREG
ncbi:PAS domain-containing protein [Candidatus Saganbacteria bacterium]|nr:PAS domain-containing protein [Candidatus Saganbacteria bacterium]